MDRFSIALGRQPEREIDDMTLVNVHPFGDPIMSMLVNSRLKAGEPVKINYVGGIDPASSNDSAVGVVMESRGNRALIRFFMDK